VKNVLNNLKLFRFHNSTVFVAKHRKDGASEIANLHDRESQARISKNQ